jgi:small subunit ribosomal protein S8
MEDRFMNIIEKDVILNTLNTEILIEDSLVAEENELEKKIFEYSKESKTQKFLIKQPKDILSDSIARIRNGYMSKKKVIELFDTNLVRSVLVCMKQEGFLSDFEIKKDDRGHNYISLNLLYTGKKQASIVSLRLMSKPSRRLSVKHNGIKELYKTFCYNGFGCAFISTSQGVLAGHDAAVRGIGGQILFVCF